MNIVCPNCNKTMVRSAEGYKCNQCGNIDNISSAQGWNHVRGRDINVLSREAVRPDIVSGVQFVDGQAPEQENIGAQNPPSRAKRKKDCNV